MQKQLLFGFAAVALLTACSQDETVNSRDMESNAIRIGINLGNNSRAYDSYCPHILPSGFRLTAMHADEDGNNLNGYFADTEMIIKPGADIHAAEFADGSLRYWPDNALNFFAWYTSQAGVEVTYTKTDDGYYDVPSILNFEVDPDVSGQEDLLYAMAYGATKEGKTVQLDFEHALSQVTFSAKCENPSIEIDIKEVGIKGLYGKGDFHFVYPYSSESGLRDTDMADEMMSYGKARRRMSATEESRNWTRKAGDTPSAQYLIAINGGQGVTIKNEPTIDEDGETVTKVISLSEAPADELHGDMTLWADIMQLIPQHTSILKQAEMSLLKAKVNRAADDAAGLQESDTDPLELLCDDVYLMVRCDIYGLNEDNNRFLMFSSDDSEGVQYLLIPVAINWKSGFRYDYTLNFNNGEGGIISDDPVLSRINVQIEVDEFIPVGVPAGDDEFNTELVNMKR